MDSVLNIGPRLEAVVELCPKAKIIADVGCDHGLVTAELVLQNKTEMVVATEKSEQCLNKAILLVDSINISPFVSFRQGDGFEPVTKYDKIQAAVIAGMGGDEIIHILENKPRNLFNFVLQPMKDVPKLREYLNSHGYKILVDKLVKEDDKFYNVIRVTRGSERLSELELFFGKTNFTDNYEVFYEFLTIRQKQLADFKSKVGQLASKLQIEYEYITEALKLFEDESEDESNENSKSENSVKNDVANAKSSSVDDDGSASSADNTNVANDEVDAETNSEVEAEVSDEVDEAVAGEEVDKGNISKVNASGNAVNDGVDNSNS